MQSPAGAIRSGNYKLIEYFENRSVQLFNLEDDIGEQNNLFNSQPDKAAELLGKLHAWRKKVGAQMMEPNQGFEDGNYPWAN